MEQAVAETGRGRRTTVCQGFGLGATSPVGSGLSRAKVSCTNCFPARRPYNTETGAERPRDGALFLCMDGMPVGSATANVRRSRASRWRSSPGVHRLAADAGSLARAGRCSTMRLRKPVRHSAELAVPVEAHLAQIGKKLALPPEQGLLTVASCSGTAQPCGLARPTQCAAQHLPSLGA